MTKLVKRTTETPMGLFGFERTPFDILFKDFFKNLDFMPVEEHKIDYPVDIKEYDDRLEIDIAVVGADKKDINIEIIDGQILKVSYDKEEKEEKEDVNVIQKSIARRNFNMSWKISNRYNLDEISASMDKGILTLNIPLAEHKKNAKKVDID